MHQSITKRIIVLLMLITWLMLTGITAIAQDEPSSDLENDPNVTIHVVQRGETLYRIALQYGLTVNEIARVNGIINHSNILVGQRILIPTERMPIVTPPRTHTVGPGDTIALIANAYGVSQQQIIDLNELSNPNALFIGQQLTIIPETETEPIVPETEAETIVTEPEAVPEDEVLRADLTHIVSAGETLFTISQRYGISMARIQEANNILDPNRITAGQNIVIPNAGEAIITSDLPELFTQLSIRPTQWIEGKTGRVNFSTSTPSTVIATFLGKDVPVISSAMGTDHGLYVAVPLLSESGVYPLSLTVTDLATGATTPFTANISLSAGSYYSQRISLPVDKAELTAKAVEDNELAILQRVTAPFTPETYMAGPMSIPAAAPMNVPFGLRRSYNGGPFDRLHLGADFAAAAGTPVLAASSGRVVLADQLFIRGTTVVIDHGWGIYTLYAHMSDRSVNLGDFVQQGQVIGIVGSSGRATGSHLHWEMWVNGEAVDPMQWIYEAFP